MNNIRKQKKSNANHRVNVSINRDEIKEIILDSYKEIEEQRREKHMPTEFLKIPLSIIFFILKFVLAFMAIIFLITPFYILYSDGPNIANIFIIAISLSIMAICGLFAYICHSTGKDIDKETDKYYIVNYFSAVVAFVALIIALISLYTSYS